MPMDYTDERVVSDGAALFRPKEQEESLEEYRRAFAHNVLVCSRDFIMANEIILGRGWDKWTEDEILDWLLDTPPSEVCRIPLGTNWTMQYKEKLKEHRRKRTRLGGAVASSPEEIRRYQDQDLVCPQCKGQSIRRNFWDPEGSSETEYTCKSCDYTGARAMFTLTPIYQAERTPDRDPRGLQEAIRGKLEYTPEDAPKGVRIRHFDKKGRETHVTSIKPFAKPEKKDR